MHNKKTSHGFTIVELLIVVAIIGILAAVAVPAYFNHILRTHQAEAYHNLLDIKAAEEMFYTQYNRYGSFDDVGTENFPNLLSFDPADNTYYTYLVAASGPTYTAAASAMNTMKKLKDINIIITNDTDPCLELPPGEKTLSLGLDECP